MNRKSLFQIAQCVGWPGTEPAPMFPFWIIETYFSVEGPRCRVCAEHFLTQAEAEQWLKEHAK